MNESNGFLRAETLEIILSRPMPETPWAVEGLLCVRDIAILGGKGGEGKSWIALYMALAMAAGEPIFGILPCIKPLRVAIIDLESRPWEIDQRLYRLANGMAIDAIKVGERIQVVRERLRLDKRSDFDRLLVSLEKWETEVLVIDSMRRTHAGDENSSNDTSNLFLHALDPIRNSLGTAILLTDHVRKRTGDKTLDSPSESLRGSTDKFNMSDLVIGVERRRDGKILISPSKGRHRGAPLAPFLVEFTGFRMGEAEDSPVAAKYVGPLEIPHTEVERRIMGILDEMGGEGALRGEIIDLLEYHQRTVDEALRAMRKKGDIRVAREGKQTRYFVVG